MVHRIFIVLILVMLAACATSPLGRQQLRLLPDSQLAQMGAAAYQDLKRKTGTVSDPRVNRYVRCVADAITRQARSNTGRWEVSVFEDPTANAFALPGGKIGVNSGLLKVAQNQDQLATVLGHEVAHVVAGHPNERVSTAYATQTGLQLIQALAGAPTPAKRSLLGLLGAGAQYGIILPYGRTQESEADLLGLDIMARAGFDPRQSIQLWQNMAKAGGPQPPEFLSTHPSRSTRIADLSARIPQDLRLYEQARASDRSPSCGP